MSEKIRRLYSRLRLQTKFTITHLVIATIPMIVLGIFFYVKLYDMIAADTIQTEQKASAATAPLIEDVVDQIVADHLRVTNDTFYQDVLSLGRTAKLG